MGHIHVRSCVVSMILIHGLVIQMYYQSSTAFSTLAALYIHFGSWGAGRAEQQYSTSMVLPTVLHVHEIIVDLTQYMLRTAPNQWNESDWTRFAETALEFPQLRCVVLEYGKLSKDTDRSSSCWDPACLGITDETFEPLIEAGKFTARHRTDLGDWCDVKHTVTVNHKPRAAQVEEVSNEDGESEGSHAKLEAAADYPVEGLRKYPLPDLGSIHQIVILRAHSESET